MRDPWVWPDNPAYPPQPHLRYPLTPKDADPNQKTYYAELLTSAEDIIVLSALQQYHAENRYNFPKEHSGGT